MLFANCTNLASIMIPNSVTNVGSGAFICCYNMTNVAIGNGVTSIADDAFSTCTSLTAIVVNDSNPVYCSVAGVLFDKSETVLIQYPSGKMGTYSIPNGVTRIGTNAFYYCTGLNSIIIPNSVTNIGYMASVDCTSLTNVIVGNKVASIGYAAFAGCSSLTSLYFLGNAPRFDSYVFDGDTYTTIYYLPDTLGWTWIPVGCPTILWNPQAQTNDAKFGVRTNQFGFNITGTSGLSIVVEACSDISNPVWQPVATNTLTGGTSYFSDSQWTNYPGRFYRLRSP
jgi:hypothetical protein